MAAELSAQVVLADGLCFIGRTQSGHEVTMDAAATAGSAGPTPMELVLISLAGCSAMDVITILRKQRQPVAGLEVQVRGERSDDRPRVFTTIELRYLVRGAGVDPVAVRRAIELSQERYCPVWAMLGRHVQIIPSFQIVGESG